MRLASRCFTNVLTGSQNHPYWGNLKGMFKAFRICVLQFDRLRGFWATYSTCMASGSHRYSGADISNGDQLILSHFARFSQVSR